MHTTRVLYHEEHWSFERDATHYEFRVTPNRGAGMTTTRRTFLCATAKCTALLRHASICCRLRGLSGNFANRSGHHGRERNNLCSGSRRETTRCCRDVNISLEEIGLGDLFALRVVSESPDSIAAVTFGGSRVNPEGQWRPNAKEYIRDGNVIVARMSAAVLRAVEPGASV